MDFEGQRRAEQHLLRALLFFGLVGFLAGYVTSSFSLMVYISAAGLAFSLLLVVPNWAWFNRHPTPWLPASAGHAASSSLSGDSGAGGKPATTTTMTAAAATTPRTAKKTA